jgi:hypothetical protein
MQFEMKGQLQKFENCESIMFCNIRSVGYLHASERRLSANQLLWNEKNSNKTVQVVTSVTIHRKMQFDPTYSKYTRLANSVTAAKLKYIFIKVPVKMIMRSIRGHNCFISYFSFSLSFH